MGGAGWEALDGRRRNGRRRNDVVACGGAQDEPVAKDSTVNTPASAAVGPATKQAGV